MVLKVKESSNFASTCLDAEKIEEEKKNAYDLVLC